MFDGNGNWTSDFSAQADRDNGIKILASRFDNIFIADIKESFENCLTKDGQIMPIGNFNMGGQRITNMADGVNANDAVNKSQLDAILSSLVPVGAILPYGGTSAPSGFLMCDGSAVSRTTYANLFAIIGISYGSGDGVNTFNLPDYRDRTVFMRNDKAVGRTSLGSIPDHRHSIAVKTGSSGWDGSGAHNGTSYSSYASADTSLFGSSLYSQTVNKVIPSHASCNFIIRY